MIAGIPYDWEIEYLESTGTQYIDTGYGILPETGQTRIYTRKITSGNILVRNLVPVRIGNVGYMYDRVTRKLFGNAGTGNFVLGPDVARPVMGLRGMRTISFTAKDYSHDGLVCMWDGIENAGYGIHDDNAETWVNLAPLSTFSDATIRKASNYSRPAPFDNNSCRLDGTFWWQFTAPTNYSSFFTGDLTITIVKKLGTPSITDGTNFFGLSAVYSTAQSMSGTSQTLKMRMGSNEAQHNVSPISSAPPELHVTAVKTVSGSQATYRFYKDGTLYNTQTVTTRTLGSGRTGYLFGSSGNTFGGSGRYWNPSPAAPGHAWALRFHNRAFTASEVAYNYTIDKARFNLP